MNLENDIQVLAIKAKNAHDSADALRFSQAAQNLSHADSIVACTGTAVGERAQTAHGIEYRNTGNTEGKALCILGDLLQAGKPYEVCLAGSEPTTAGDRVLLNRISDQVELLDLDHFHFDRLNLTIKYDVEKRM